MCGEHYSVGFAFVPTAGSSPHVRGTHHLHRRGTAEPRFIPACAGNTSGLRPVRRPCSVHPRMCGEHYGTGSGAPEEDGSSPHVRGTRLRPRPLQLELRFIPACAGNTAMPTASRSGTTVHPRMCGEHPGALTMACRSRGSSPHVRGTPRVVARRFDEVRFIPACAGNTSRPRLTSARRSVHPRMCGEHPGKARFRTIDFGSSPHVRGTRRK